MTRLGFTLTVLTLICGLLSSCGFHLRGGFQLPDGDIYVSSNIDSLVARALKKKIERKRSGALATDPLAADITISITEENSQKVLAVLSNTGSIDEYEITYNVTFGISSKNGHIESPVQDRLTLKRQMTYEDQALTDKSDEERALIEDMASEVATRILVRLSRVTQTQ